MCGCARTWKRWACWPPIGQASAHMPSPPAPLACDIYEMDSSWLREDPRFWSKWRSASLTKLPVMVTREDRRASGSSHDDEDLVLLGLEDPALGKGRCSILLIHFAGL